VVTGSAAVDRRQPAGRRRDAGAPANRGRLEHEHQEAEDGAGRVTPLYWLGFNGRFDWVQPDIDAAPGNPGGSDKSSR
jgi:hypothetical protein